jgi:putrescine transport system ATP-binding protein
MSAPLVRIERLSKRFGSVSAVDDVSLEIAEGEFFALLGPSGCGKTTLMRMIAGFEQPDAGRIFIDGADVSAQPPHRRPVNMMFQSYALFPHMNVEKNIGFALRRQGLPSGVIAERVRDMLRLVQLEGLGGRRPDQLSGGQKARVALARALAARPRLLLLDEPLSALDRKLREETQFELMQVQRDLRLGFLVVTHDQDEAMSMAQRIAVMRNGRIEQLGAARDLYEKPQSAWVASFIGESNLLDVSFAGREDAIGSGQGRLSFVAGGARVSALAENVAGDQTLSDGERVKIAVRAERIALSRIRPEADNILAGEVVDTAYLGDTITLRVSCADGVQLRIRKLSATGETFERGDHVFASWPAEAARVLPR